MPGDIENKTERGGAPAGCWRRSRFWVRGGLGRTCGRAQCLDSSTRHPAIHGKQGKGDAAGLHQPDSPDSNSSAAGRFGQCGLQSDLNVVTKKLRLTQGDLKKAREEAAEIKTESEQKISELDGSVKNELAEKVFQRRRQERGRKSHGRPHGPGFDSKRPQNGAQRARNTDRQEP